MPARALAPGELAGIVGQAEAVGGESLAPWLAFGDGAIRFRGHLELAGVVVPADSSPLHVVGARAVCDLGARAPAVASYEEIVPDYRRRAGCRDRSGGRLSPGGPRTVTELSAAQLGASHSPPIEIRRLIYTDLPQVIGIERRVFPTPWSLAMFVLELSKQSGICLAAVCEQRLVGYLICSRYDTVWHVMNVAVDIDRQRMGLASALLAELYARVNDKDARFTLEVRRSNHVAIHLYEREGFRAAGVRRRYYQDNGEDALVMWRTPATLADPSGMAPLTDVPNPGPV